MNSIIRKSIVVTSTLLIFLVSTNGLIGQNAYFPDETVWTRGASSFGNPFPPVYNVLCGDTLINETVYKKMYKIDDSNSNGEIYVYGLREEDQKIWRVQEDIEELLYDFSLEVGDTFSTVVYGFPLDLIVEVVSYEEIYGINRKKITFKSVNNFPQESWYEGIGSNRGFSERGTGNQTDGGTWLCCIKIENELLYASASSSCDCSVGDFSDFGLTCSSITSIEPLKSVSFLNLYPNPSNGLLLVEKNSNEPILLEIYDVIGSLIYSNKLQQDSSIDLTALISGVYFVKIINLRNKQVQLQKLILK